MNNNDNNNNNNKNKIKIILLTACLVFVLFIEVIKSIFFFYSYILFWVSLFFVILYVEEIIATG